MADDEDNYMTMADDGGNDSWPSLMAANSPQNIQQQ